MLACRAAVRTAGSRQARRQVATQVRSGGAAAAAAAVLALPPLLLALPVAHTIDR
jgi:hypothetical protein